MSIDMRETMWKALADAMLVHQSERGGAAGVFRPPGCRKGDSIR
ncbi:hypothetical protein [Desulfatiglans anilini]|nr:hypothetical protein [Desulfatiglans anilini]